MIRPADRAGLRSLATLFALAGVASGILIGGLLQSGSISDKAITGIVAGGILAAFGGFVGVYIGKMKHPFGDSWPLFLVIVVLVAAVWSFW